MKRMFVFVSILLLFASNIAMAIDYDCSASLQDLSTLNQDQTPDPSNNDQADSGCHNVAHFVGIYPYMINIDSTMHSHYLPVPVFITRSQTYQPATPPPNA